MVQSLDFAWQLFESRVATTSRLNAAKGGQKECTLVVSARERAFGVNCTCLHLWTAAMVTFDFRQHSNIVKTPNDKLLSRHAALTTPLFGVMLLQWNLCVVDPLRCSGHLHRRDSKSCINTLDLLFIVHVHVLFCNRHLLKWTHFSAKTIVHHRHVPLYNGTPL